MILGYKKIFWGTILTIFHLNLGTIEILPNFIGFLIISAGIKEILCKYDNQNIRMALKINRVQVYISCIIFISPFIIPSIGFDKYFNNTILTTIWFNINYILEIICTVKLLEGASEILSDNFNNYWGDIYINKTISYIYLDSIVLIVCNINFIFISELTAFLIAIYAMIIKIWVVFSFRKLYTHKFDVGYRYINK
ncbi:hypothetical protein R0131_09065 [Clostridium sp. AL.422]|uniref:hypothetical protein n=1 Tax=Clostridium TaxID=1485 RepID=UPI00293DBFB0|nr:MULTISPECIES: hypothetical protein [unclassified Clostridium]MDV4150986.1 hypothetical protein [Clostridium sp. AL.422]